jgi:hypothetical protein
MRLTAVALALAACGPELNPPRAPEGLADGGVYVAYNRGCELGCDRLRRGDRILAVDGLAVASGAEFGHDHDTPVILVIDRRGVVRFHADASHVPDERLATAVEFARTALPDRPIAAR